MIPTLSLYFFGREIRYHHLYVNKNFIDKNSETCDVTCFNFRFVAIEYHNFMRSPCDSIVTCIHVQVHNTPIL